MADPNGTTNSAALKLPRWQEISGLRPERLDKMSDDEYDAGVRALLEEVKRLARKDFARGENAPSGERTIFWDPLERICRVLEISRTKLSALSRELTGLRAHEITDCIKAQTLPARVHAWLSRELTPMLQQLEERIDRKKLSDQYYLIHLQHRCWKQLKETRRGPARARWAMELGFANPSRVQRACLLAQHMSIEELEARLFSAMVQKFFERLKQDGAANSKDARPEATAASGQKPAHPPVLTPEETEQLIQEAIGFVQRRRSSAA
ncbi:MAG TPA: hypothetical protein VEK08_20235 [Planctomycetota bacterium]|nr:hypothetical protein [Planctomycetota bacterium]